MIGIPLTGALAGTMAALQRAAEAMTVRNLKFKKIP